MERKSIDVEKAVAVIEKDRIIHGSLVEMMPTSRSVCESPGHCAVGALLFAAGATNAELADWSGEPGEWATDEKPTKLLWEHYGLRRWHATWLVSANDSIPGRWNPDVRQQRVVQQLRHMAADQIVDPDADWKRCEEYDEPREP